MFCFPSWPREDRIWVEKNYFEETSTVNPVCLLGQDKSLAEILSKREPERMGMARWPPDMLEPSRGELSCIPREISLAAPSVGQRSCSEPSGLCSSQPGVSEGPPSALEQGLQRWGQGGL